jgi:asparagine synthase (glutamine-hydrolysing)
MCGIAGFERKITTTELARFEPVLKHRGPDHTGFFQDHRFSFIHWRLSVIDLSQQANQPYRYQHLVLVYNGEIYNYQKLAEELKKYGYVFDTTSDTEVVIKAYHCWGVEAFHRFIGMFAFAIYDCNTGELLLVRDRMGVKPLYYLTGTGFAFASELKMLKSLPVSLTLNPVALHQYFRFGFIPAPLSIYNEIKKLPPGHYLRFANGKTEIHAWYTLPFPPRQHSIKSAEECAADLEQLLISAFTCRMVADVPVGVFLSGGIDSSLLTAILSKHITGTIQTFTIGFDQPRYDERHYARQVASLLNTHHTELQCSINDARSLFEEFYEVYDEPFADTSGIPATLVARLAKQNGIKVVLSADGGDELFGGYPHYTGVDKWHRYFHAMPASIRYITATLLKWGVPYSLRKYLVTANLAHRIDKLEELLRAKNDIGFFEAAIGNQSQRAIYQLIGRHISAIPLLADFPAAFKEKMMQWDMRFYLPDDLLAKIDRATMYTGVEAREPFLDHRLVEWAINLPLHFKITNNTSKYLLRKVLFKYLPPQIFERPKQGFSIPIFKWFAENLNYFAERYVKSNVHTGILNPEAVKLELRRFQHYSKRNKEYNVEKAWRIISFLMWNERWNR